MCKSINCEKCDGYTKLSSRIKPQRPTVPEYVPPPPLVYLYGDEPSDQSSYEEKSSWFLVWLFGLFLGISIGLLIAKSL